MLSHMDQPSIYHILGQFFIPSPCLFTFTIYYHNCDYVMDVRYRVTMFRMTSMGPLWALQK